MKYALATLAFGLGASAFHIPRASCSFSLVASGGVNGTVGQLSDGQNRINGSYSEATYSINNGQITDSSNRGCILTPPTTQFQCDVGATPTGGFSIGCHGEVSVNGSTAFYACPATDTEYNIYTTPVENQPNCKNITLSATGCYNACTSIQTQTQTQTQVSVQTQVQTKTEEETQTQVQTKTEEQTQTQVQVQTKTQEETQTQVQTQTAPGQTIYKTETQTVQSTCPAPVTTTVTSTVSSVKTEQVTSTVTQSAQTQTSTVTATQPAQTVSVTVTATATQPAQTVSVTQPAQTVTKTETKTEIQAASTPAATSSAAPSPSKVSSATSSPTSSSCPTTLTSGSYQYPHLIIPVSSSSPSTAYGTSYNGIINSTTSSIFNFDIPSSYTGTCSLVFLFPEQKDLETSSFTFSGNGVVDFKQLDNTATQATTYASQGSVKKDFGDFTVTPGSSTVIATFSCPAGQAVAYEASAVSGTAINYFQDYNPSPIGLYITTC